MTKITLSVAMLSMLLLSFGCALVAPFQPPQGAVFSNTQAPLDVNYDKTELGQKSGSASAYNVLGLFAFGDAGTQAAARDGHLSIINHADYTYFNFLFLFQKTTVTVYGE